MSNGFFPSKPISQTFILPYKRSSHWAYPITISCWGDSGSWVEWESPLWTRKASSYILKLVEMVALGALEVSKLPLWPKCQHIDFASLSRIWLRRLINIWLKSFTLSFLSNLILESSKNSTPEVPSSPNWLKKEVSNCCHDAIVCYEPNTKITQKLQNKYFTTW